MKMDIEKVIELAEKFDELDEITKKGIELQVAAINLYKAQCETEKQKGENNEKTH